MREERREGVKDVREGRKERVCECTDLNGSV